jgi:hypothetical protein
MLEDINYWGLQNDIWRYLKILDNIRRILEDFSSSNWIVIIILMLFGIENRSGNVFKPGCYKFSVVQFEFSIIQYSSVS